MVWKWLILNHRRKLWLEQLMTCFSCDSVRLCVTPPFVAPSLTSNLILKDGVRVSKHCHNLTTLFNHPEKFFDCFFISHQVEQSVCTWQKMKSLLLPLLKPLSTRLWRTLKFLVRIWVSFQVSLISIYFLSI